jgi:hypothetical protein
MRDRVWDRTASRQSEYKEYSALRRDDGGTGRHQTDLHHAERRTPHQVPRSPSIKDNTIMADNSKK